MDREQLASKATAFPYLQGLLAIPIGLFLLTFGLGQLLWDPVAPWMFLGGAVVTAVLYRIVSRYYANHYGRITPSSESRVRDGVMTVVGIVAILAGAVGDDIFDWPISGYAAGYSVVMLIYVHLTIGLKAHHLAVWGGLLAASLLPVWSGLGIEKEVPLSLLPMGAATIVAGLFDHSLLVRTFGRPQDLSVDGNGA